MLFLCDNRRVVGENMAKKIMFQGTGSSVGKSVIVAAVCRVLNNRGYAVAPFKSQNMSLNAYITESGGEMGRAQVVQAEAARILPTVDMNPILLKPTGDTGSQVIVLGKVVGNMTAKDYFSGRNRDQLLEAIDGAYARLNAQYDVLVIEGAGSPAEINLRRRDLVNMGLAERIDTDVILIGDVDKGGVFAALYGTVMLLEPEERKRIRGFLINKFRGDVSLLEPGIRMLEEKIDIPCVGVIPYLHSLAVDEEDSVTERFGQRRSEADEALYISVIRLPYMSNFTDFSVLDTEPGVSVCYAAHPRDLEGADLIVIPGSKHTLHDMRFLNASGMAEALYRAHRRGVPIMGICGGFQMLGRRIFDPEAVESLEGGMPGLGLLDIQTVMAPDKTTRQARGTVMENFAGIELKGLPVEGYEIHMGLSTAASEAVRCFLETRAGCDGAVDETGTVLGTYFHGIFDGDAFRQALLNGLSIRRGGISDARSAGMSFEKRKEAEYDRLAAHVEAHMDFDVLEQWLDESRTSHVD